MSEYRINNLYITEKNDYEWQSRVLDHMGDMKVVSAPHQVGKTFMCRDAVIEALEYGRLSQNILYYTPAGSPSVRRMVKNITRPLENESEDVTAGQSDGCYIIRDVERDTAIYLPMDRTALCRKLGSGLRFQMLVMDDADEMNPVILHTVILKGAVDEASMLFVGSHAGEERNPGEKSMWCWLLNHPSADVFYVQHDFPMLATAADSALDCAASLTHYLKDVLLRPTAAPSAA